MDDSEFYKKIQMIIILLALLGLAVGIFIGWKIGVMQSNTYFTEYIENSCSCFVSLF